MRRRTAAVLGCGALLVLACLAFNPSSNAPNKETARSVMLLSRISSGLDALVTAKDAVLFQQLAAAADPTTTTAAAAAPASPIAVTTLAAVVAATTHVDVATTTAAAAAPIAAQTTAAVATPPVTAAVAAAVAAAAGGKAVAASHAEGKEASHAEGKEASHAEGKEASHAEGKEPSHAEGKEASHTEGKVVARAVEEQKQLVHTTAGKEGKEASQAHAQPGFWGDAWRRVETVNEDQRERVRKDEIKASPDGMGPEGSRIRFHPSLFVGMLAIAGGVAVALYVFVGQRRLFIRMPGSDEVAESEAAGLPNTRVVSSSWV